MTSVSYTPPPTCRQFMLDRSFIRIITGPYGSGKSTACVMELWARAQEQPPDINGVRHSCFALVRTTTRKLLDTTLVTFLKWFPDGVAGTWWKTNKTFISDYQLADGTRVKAEFKFRALDDAADVENLASLELNGAYINELKEADRAIFDAMKGRVGRFLPQGVDPTKTPVLKFVIADTNPPVAAEYDWCYTLMEIDAKSEEWAGRIKVFRQPSGLSPEAENLENLPGGRQYYEDMCIGATDEFIRVNVHGEYGTAMGGKTVFEKSFKHELHVAKRPLKPVARTPWGDPLTVVVGMDFGLTPAAVFEQTLPNGQTRVLDELIGDNIGLRQFLRTKLRPLIAARYKGMRIVIVGDPAGNQRGQTEERTCYDVLAEEGFRAIPASTNSLVRRLGAVEDKLRTLVDEGEPALIISPHCTTIVKAFTFGYRYKEIPKPDGSVYTVPDKNAFSHPMDALQYGTLHLDELGVPLEEDEDAVTETATSDRPTGY